MITKGGGSEPGDGYFQECFVGVGPGGRILDPIMMTVGEPRERIYCSLGRKILLTWGKL